jgi:hypothetical protein
MLLEGTPPPGRLRWRDQLCPRGDPCSTPSPPPPHTLPPPSSPPTHNPQQTPIKDGHAASKAILALEGVVDHGLFLDMVDVCIIAGGNGVEVKERK